MKPKHAESGTASDKGKTGANLADSESQRQKQTVTAGHCAFKLPFNTTRYVSDRQFWVMMYLGGRARYYPRLKGHPRKGRNWTAIKWRKGYPGPEYVEPFRDDPFTIISAMNKRIADAFAWRSNSPALENQR